MLSVFVSSVPVLVLVLVLVTVVVIVVVVVTKPPVLLSVDVGITFGLVLFQRETILTFVARFVAMFASPAWLLMLLLFRSSLKIDAWKLSSVCNGTNTFLFVVRNVLLS